VFPSTLKTSSSFLLFQILFFQIFLTSLWLADPCFNLSWFTKCRSGTLTYTVIIVRPFHNPVIILIAINCCHEKVYIFDLRKDDNIIRVELEGLNLRHCQLYPVFQLPKFVISPKIVPSLIFEHHQVARFLEII